MRIRLKDRHICRRQSQWISSLEIGGNGVDYISLLSEGMHDPQRSVDNLSFLPTFRQERRISIFQVFRVIPWSLE